MSWLHSCKRYAARGSLAHGGQTMSENTKSVAELAAEIKAEHQRAVDAVKGIAEEALGKAQAGEELATSLKETADEALIKMNGLSEQVAEIEQKLARAGAIEGEETKSFGEQFVGSDGFEAFAGSGFSKGARGADIRVRATLSSAATDADGSVGAASAGTRLPGMLELPQRR